MPRTRTPRHLAAHLVALAASLAVTAHPLPAQQPPDAPYVKASGMLSGDFDGDGRDDVLAVENGLRVWPGLGDGSFGAFALTQAPGSRPPAAVGDVDGDGRDDVAYWRVLGGEPARVDVALATGAGLFAPTIQLALPGGNGSVRAVALADVDGDGDLDALVGRESEVRLLVWLGDGQGGFASGADIQGVKSTQQIEPGDVNADGRIDLVLRGHVAVGGESIVGVVFGQPGGSFSAPLIVPAPLHVASVRATDLSGDGHDDLVLLQQLPGEPPLLAVWEPHGAGFTAPEVIVALEENGVIDVARSADLDEDGRNDLVLVDSRSRVTVLTQQADGTLGDPVRYAAWPGARDVLLADVDENGGRDVLAFGDGPATHLAGTGSGLFGPALGLPDEPRDLVAADFDGDGRDELVSLDFGGGPLLVHGADPLGGWDAPVEVDVGPEKRRLAAGRFTRDARPDLLVVRGGAGTSAVALLPSTAGGGFGAPLVTPLAFTAVDGWATDVDDDGLLDVLVEESGAATIHVLLNGGGGAFAESAVLGPFQSPRRAAGADLTGDGVTDVVVASVEGNGRISVFPGMGDGTFLAPVVTDMAVPSWPHNLALGDVDMDGALDAAFYVGIGSTVILPGLGDGGFGTAEVLGGKIFEQLLLTDLDRDGLLDLVGARSGMAPFEFGTVHVRYGTGTLAFGPSVSTPAPGGAKRLVVADADGDGAPDLALASELPQLVVLSNADGPWQELGHSLAGSNGFSRLTGVGTLQPGSPMELLVTHGPPLAPTTLVLGLGESLAPFQGGVLVPTPDVVLPGLLTNGAGGIALVGHWPPGMAPGTTLLMQAWFVDGATPGGAAATTGLAGTTP